MELASVSLAGSGRERFLLLHGNPGSLSDLAPLFERLTTLGTVTAYDAPGFGRSPTPADARTLRIEASAEIAVQVLDHHGWEHATVIGHSHGGGVAQRIARRWPGRVRALVLLGTLGAPAHASYRLLPLPGVGPILTATGRLFGQMPASLQRSLAERFMRVTHGPGGATPTEIEHQISLLRDNQDILRNMSRVTMGRPCLALEAEAPGIEAPTLFIHGREDRIVPIHHARHIYERMMAGGRAAEFLEVPGGGHMLASQVPALVVDAIGRFLSTPPP